MVSQGVGKKDKRGELLVAHPESVSYLCTESEYNVSEIKLAAGGEGSTEYRAGGNQLSVQRNSVISSNDTKYSPANNGNGQPGSMGNRGGSRSVFASYLSRAGEMEQRGGGKVVTKDRERIPGKIDHSPFRQSNADPHTENDVSMGQYVHMERAGHENGLGNVGVTGKNVNTAEYNTQSFSHFSRNNTRLEENAVETNDGIDSFGYLPAFRDRNGSPDYHTMDRKHGKVWVIVGPKGGVGKTTVLANIAIALNRPVGIVDLDVPFSNVASLFRHRPKLTWDNWDGNSSIIEASSSVRENIYLMSGSAGIVDEPKKPTVEQAISAVKQMRKELDYVLVDNGSWLSDYIQEVCTIADKILLVTTPDQASVVNTMHFLKWVDKTEVAQVEIVMNRTLRRLPYKISELVEATGCPVSLVLPEVPKVTTYAWNGVLMVEKKPRHVWSKAIYNYLRDVET